MHFISKLSRKNAKFTRKMGKKPRGRKLVKVTLVSFERFKPEGDRVEFMVSGGHPTGTSLLAAL